MQQTPSTALKDLDRRQTLSSICGMHEAKRWGEAAYHPEGFLQREIALQTARRAVSHSS